MQKFKDIKTSIFLCVLFFLIGIFFCQIDFEKLKPKTSSDFAAWIQAVGSILAIVVAIFIPFKMDKNRKNEADSHQKKLFDLAIADANLKLYPMKAAFVYLLHLSGPGLEGTNNLDERWRHAVQDLLRTVPRMTIEELKSIAAVEPGIAKKWIQVLGNYDQIVHGLLLGVGGLDESHARTINGLSKLCIEALDELEAMMGN